MLAINRCLYRNITLLLSSSCSFFLQPDPSINQFHFCRDDILLGAFKGEFGREVWFRCLLSLALDFDLNGIPMFSVFLFSALVLWIHRRSCGKFSVSCETLRPGSELLLTQILLNGHFLSKIECGWFAGGRGCCSVEKISCKSWVQECHHCDCRFPHKYQVV